MEGPTLPAVFGRYILLKGLGRGAMGDVHLARPINPHRGLPPLVVLKRLRGELIEREAFVARFRHEAALAVSVDSPHVAKVYDVGSVGSALYIVMEYVDGWPLSEVLDNILKSGRHASIASVLDLMVGGLRGLEALHTATDPCSGQPLGIVHRDLSPKNLMVGEDGELRLIDLGLGKSNLQDWRTRTGVVMGSIGYMPPEQARGERVDQRADIYAFAAVAFEMFALRNYIKRGPVAQMMTASVKPPFVPPSEYRPDVPAGLDEVLRVALAPKASDRYPTARAFRDALDSVVSRRHTRGGMRSLLADLFGASRTTRQRELQGLMALPDPEPDGFDTQPTKVFALGAGVSPDEPEDRTAATELSSRTFDSAPVRVRRVWPDPASLQHPVQTSKSPRTVSMSVLVGSIVAAAILGGILAVALQYMLEADPLPVRTPKALAPTAAQRPEAEGASPPAEPPGAPELGDGSLKPAEPPAATSARRRRRRVVPPTSPLRGTPSSAPTVADLDARLDALAQQVDRERGPAEGARRRALTGLLVAIRQARTSQDAARKAASIEAIQRQLQGLVD